MTSGRIFSVEQKSRIRNDVSEPVTEMTLVADEGSIKTIELTAATTVRLAERDVREDISSYLGITASARGEDVRRMINTQIADIERDQQRVRENMKALRGSDEEKALTQRYTRQLGEQEDRLTALRDDLKKAAAERDARRRELSELAARLQFEIAG